jgi:hypothetical protein
MPQAYPKFFDLNGTPLRLLTRDAVPQRYTGNGQWEPFVDVERFVADAIPLDPNAVDELLRATTLRSAARTSPRKTG